MSTSKLPGLYAPQETEMALEWKDTMCMEQDGVSGEKAIAMIPDYKPAPLPLPENIMRVWGKRGHQHHALRIRRPVTIYIIKLLLLADCFIYVTQCVISSLKGVSLHSCRENVDIIEPNLSSITN